MVVSLDFGPNRLERQQYLGFPMPPGRGVATGQAAQLVIRHGKSGAVCCMEM
jgi:hypothetical protein